MVAGASEGINFPSLGHGDLRDDVRRAAEAINPKPLSLAGPHERTVADEAGAHQWSSVDSLVAGGRRKAVPFTDHRAFGIAAVYGVPSEARVVAEVFPVRAAIRALTARECEPAYPYPIAQREAVGSLAQSLDRPDDLVAWHKRQLGRGEFAVNYVQVCPADAAGKDTDEHLARPWTRNRALHRLQRAAWRCQDHRIVGIAVRRLH